MTPSRGWWQLLEGRSSIDCVDVEEARRDIPRQKKKNRKKEIQVSQTGNINDITGTAVLPGEILQLRPL